MAEPRRGRSPNARIITEAGEFAEALLHCQQAVEKALKGYLTYHRQTFRKTHDLSDLIAACLVIDDSLSPTMDGIDDLSEYAWQFGYPGAPRQPDRAEADAALAKAELVLRAVRDRTGL